MRVRIIRERFGGMGWRAEPGVLHLGGVGTAGAEKLEFELPEEWDGMAVTLHVEQEGGTLPQPVLLDDSSTVTVDRRFTAARQGLWMLLAQSADGYTAMSCPAKYDCYSTIELSGTVEDIEPSVYAQFVALVQQAVDTALNSVQDASASAKTAQAAAEAARETTQAAQQERLAAEKAQNGADLAAANTGMDLRAAAEMAANAQDTAEGTMKAAAMAVRAANRAADMTARQEERQLLLKLLREAAYQSQTADGMLDELDKMWAEVPAENVALTRKSLTLTAGEQAAVGAQVSPENATGKVSWESDRADIATVEDGVITAKTPGEAWITATAGGCSAQCRVIVKPAVDKVSLSKDTLSLTVGGSATLTASVEPGGEAEWSSSAPEIVSVERGVVTAKAAGSAVVTAASGRRYAACAVRARTPEMQVKSVALSADRLTLKPGQKATLTAAVSPDDAEQRVEWYSTQPDTAAVNKGSVLAIASGTAGIVAEAGSAKAVCTVTVEDDGQKVASILLSAEALELFEGKTAALTATVLPTDIPQESIVWTSSNEDAATVAGGVVTGKAAGAAVIRASVGGKVASCAVTVKAVRVAVTSVTLSRSTLDLETGGTAQLTATVRPENADDRTVTWSSDAPEVAKVDSGTVRGIAEGVAKVRAEAGGVSGVCTVTVATALVWCSVVNQLSHVTTTQTTVVVAKGRSYTATLTAEKGYTLASVSVKMDSADITATAWNAQTGQISIGAVSGSVVITASAEKTMITLTKQVKDLAVGDGFVYLTENGQKVRFYVLAHSYELLLNDLADLTGARRTLFVRESPVASGPWSDGDSSTQNCCGWGEDKRDITCSIYNYLNGTYLEMLSADAKKWLSTTRYYAYTNTDRYDSIGKNTSMSSAVFTVSAAESLTNPPKVWSTSTGHYESALQDGSLLSYEARKRLERIFTAYGKGIWTRTLGRSYSYSHKDSDGDRDEFFYHGILLSGVSDSEWGNFSYTDSRALVQENFGYLPCFTLPETLYVTDDGFISEQSQIEAT